MAEDNTFVRQRWNGSAGGCGQFPLKVAVKAIDTMYVISCTDPFTCSIHRLMTSHTCRLSYFSFAPLKCLEI